MNMDELYEREDIVFDIKKITNYTDTPDTCSICDHNKEGTCFLNPTFPWRPSPTGVCDQISIEDKSE